MTKRADAVSENLLNEAEDESPYAELDQYDLYSPEWYDKTLKIRQRGRDILDSELQVLSRKKRGRAEGLGWWLPPHNMMVNQTWMGEINLWVFRILPRQFGGRFRAYSERDHSLILHPSWRSYPKMEETVDLHEKNAERIVSIVKGSPEIPKTAGIELDIVEEETGITIPQAIRGKIVRESLKVAKRRWGVDTLRIKDTIIPLGEE